MELALLAPRALKALKVKADPQGLKDYKAPQDLLAPQAQLVSLDQRDQKEKWGLWVQQDRKVI